MERGEGDDVEVAHVVGNDDPADGIRPALAGGDAQAAKEQDGETVQPLGAGGPGARAADEE